MKITITIETEVITEEVFKYFKDKCIEALQNFSISVEGTELKYSQKKET